MAEAISLENKSPPNKAAQRQALYKKVSTPPWKETYRKKCFERLRKNREKLLTKFRHIESSEKEIDLGQDLIKDIMSREWRSLWDEEMEMTKVADFPLDISFIPPEENENIDRLLKIFEDLEEELKLEELKILEEFESYEEDLLLEEKSLCEAFEALSADEVICPICKLSPLRENKGVIFCKCGVRINTEQDGLTLNNVKQMLEDGLELHNYTCQSEPEFSTLCVLGTTNLFMTCKDEEFPLLFTIFGLRKFNPEQRQLKRFDNSTESMSQGLENGMRTVYPHGSNKELRSKFHDSSRVWHLKKAGAQNDRNVVMTATKMRTPVRKL